MTKQYKKDYFEDRKLKYQKNHGVFVHEFMFTEFSNRILGQCNASLNDLQRQLDVEIARAKAEEERLDQKIDAETTRATGEETRIDEKIDAETVRATAEETRIDGKIDEQALSNLNKINKLFNIINVSNESFTDTPNTPIPYKYLDLNNNTNDLTVNDTDRDNSTLAHSLTTSYTAISEALHAINTLYMSNNADSYTLNNQGNIIKNEGQTKLISNYNSTLMLIVSCLNELKLNVEQLIERVTALENK